MTSQKNITDSQKIAAGMFVLMFIISMSVFLNVNGNKITSLERENDRQWEYYKTLSGAIDQINRRQDSLESNIRITEDQVTRTLGNMELTKYAKIYDLEITICKIDKEHDEINKRTVTMKNVVGINPSVERTATVVDTGLWYGASVVIPTIMDDEEEYACDLKVLSVR